ncbi:MAG: PQQ-binding-like beta-propeller repeat protein, partial [bacterium]|nr:PQQ-binding-like beta-propeller repeat protein [bacterium]
MKIRKTAFVAVTIITGLFTSLAFAGDWEAWRGEDGAGISSETNWNPRALADGAKVLWKVDIGLGYSSVAVKGDKLFTMGHDKKQKSDVVHCLSVKDGSSAWTHTYECKTGSYPGPRGTPVVDDGVIYTFSRNAELNAYDAATGAKKWSLNAARESGARAPRWGFSGSPVVVGDLVIVNVGPRGMAVNKKTGR